MLRKTALKKDIVLGDKTLLKKRARVKWWSDKSRVIRKIIYFIWAATNVILTIETLVINRIAQYSMSMKHEQ